MSQTEFNEDVDNVLPLLLLETHEDIQSFATLFKASFTTPLSAEHVNNLLRASFKLISSQEGDTCKTNTVYLLFCLHVYGGVNVLSIPLRTLRILPKNPYLKRLLSCGIISITAEAFTTASTISEFAEQDHNNKARLTELEDEDTPQSYNTRTIALKRQFKTLIEDIQINDVLRDQLFNNAAQSNALHVLSTNYERWRDKVASLIKDDEIKRHFGPNKDRRTYEQQMNTLKHAYEDLLERYYLPVYPPKHTLAKYRNEPNGHGRKNASERHSARDRSRIWGANTTPPPHIFASDLDLSTFSKELLGDEQERPSTAPPDISCIHEDMPTFFE